MFEGFLNFGFEWEWGFLIFCKGVFQRVLSAKIESGRQEEKVLENLRGARERDKKLTQKINLDHLKCHL